MASIGVVVPSWHYWIDPLKLQPLWELYYATLLAQRLPDSNVDLIDLRGDEAKATRPPERDVYVYWINKSADAFEIYDIVKRLRELYPKSRHVAGGTHVDHMPEQCAQHMDVVLAGTAEEAMVRAVAGGKDGKRPAKQDHPFADYAHPRRDFLPPSRVVNGQHFQKYGSVPGTGVYFSRGCGYKCRFCVYNNPGHFDMREPAQITAEIDYLKAVFGVQGVNLRDEVCLPVNPKIAIPYIEAIAKAGVIWRGQSVPFGSEEIVRLARESGLVEVALGIESVDSNDVLRLANKPSQDIARNRAFIELLKKHGVKVKVCLVMGLPGESEAVLDRTIAFLEETQPDFVAVSGFDPVPGSPFFKEPEKFGIRFIDQDLSRHAHLLYRFGGEEEVGLPFEFEETAAWGKPLSRQRIQDNIKALQAYLRERGMSY